MQFAELLGYILNITTYCLCVGWLVDATGTYSFNTANTNTQCGDRAYKFWSAMHVPLSKCITECGRRPKCLALNHHSHYSNYCELLESTIVVTPGDGGCLYLTREDIDLNALIGNGCGCSPEETCDLATDTCSKTECSSIRSIDNGEIFGNRYSIGNSYVIKCNPGYEPDNGVTRATCLASAQWDKAPSCKKMCATLGSLPNGAISGTSLYSSQGTRLQVTCDIGYRESSGLTEITCLNNAVWDNTPECVIIECSPPSIQNGGLTGSVFTAGSTYTVQCDTRYEETYSRTTVECMLSGYWDYTPECVATFGICDYGWEQFEYSCFYVSVAGDGELNFDESETSCKNRGGNLARLDTYGKYDVVRQKLLSMSNTNNNYWIGLRRYSENGNMLWLGTDDVVTYQNYAPGQPAGNSEYCGFLWQSDGWKWHDGMCNWTEGFVCEKPSV